MLSAKNAYESGKLNAEITSLDLSDNPYFLDTDPEHFTAWDKGFRHGKREIAATKQKEVQTNNLNKICSGCGIALNQKGGTIWKSGPSGFAFLAQQCERHFFNNK